MNTNEGSSGDVGRKGSSKRIGELFKASGSNRNVKSRRQEK
jgi:hypothetical protein